MDDSEFCIDRYKDPTPINSTVGNDVFQKVKLEDAENIGVYLTDGNAYTLGVSHSYEILTEICEKEVKGKHMQDLVESGFYDRSVTLLVLKYRTPVTIEQTILNTGKKIIATGNPIYDYHGNISMVLTTDMPQPVGDYSSFHKGGKRVDPVSGVFPAMPGVIASSRIMQQVLMRAAKIAAFDSTVLIQGETGVGKNVVAEFIHRMSAREFHPFITVNMTTIPEQLFESELFGYTGGSFTGALKTGKTGLIHAAEGGTVFLDEIGDLSLANQAKLLKLLQDKEILPIGSVKTKKANVRFIAATNRNLQDMVQAGLFREDLFYRLNVATIHIPPLRERKEDVFNLAQYFLAEFCSQHNISKKLSPKAIQVLTDYTWPGNVRELHYLIERVVLLYSQEEITREHLIQELAVKSPFTIQKVSPLLRCNLQEEVAAFEKDLLVQALKHYGRDLKKVAAVLEIHRTTLLRKLRRYGLL